MIFQHTWPQILSGSKVQTRRVIRADEQAVRGLYNKIVAVMQGDRAKWQVGNEYAVQPGRGRAQIARIRVLRINSEYITRISLHDALQEGFASRQDFFRTWQQIHGAQGLGLRVWVIRFELVATDPELLAAGAAGGITPPSFSLSRPGAAQSARRRPPPPARRLPPG